MNKSDEAFTNEIISSSFLTATGNIELTNEEIILMKSFMAHYYDYLQTYCQLAMLDQMFADSFNTGYLDFKTIKGDLISAGPGSGTSNAQGITNTHPLL